MGVSTARNLRKGRNTIRERSIRAKETKFGSRPVRRPLIRGKEKAHTKETMIR
jgi:hypothetical protein